MANKNWVFTIYFNYTEAPESLSAATANRDSSLVYISKTMERMARFSIIARDESVQTKALLLRGYASLTSPCTQQYLRKILGRCSSCRSCKISEIAQLLRHFNLDNDALVTGRLPGSDRRTDDARFVLRIARRSLRDFRREDLKEDTELEEPVPDIIVSDASVTPVTECTGESNEKEN